MRLRTLTVGAIVSLGACLGCLGYNTTGRSSSNVGDIYIPFFLDETVGQRATDLGSRLTRLVVAEFQRDKEINVYQGEEERSLADKELLGTVTRLTEAVLTRDADELEEEYRVVVACSIRYVDVVSGDTIWQDSRVTGDGNYLLEQGEVGFDAALDEALDEIVEKILDKTVRAW